MIKQGCQASYSFTNPRPEVHCLIRCYLQPRFGESILKIYLLQGRAVYVSAVLQAAWPKSVEAPALPPPYLVSSPEEEALPSPNPSPVSSSLVTHAQTTK